MGYSINGTALLAPSGTTDPSDAAAPSSHSVAPSQASFVKTVGGTIAYEPPSGNINVHTWIYDGRHADVVGLLRQYIGGNPLCVIDTYDNDGTQLTGILAIVQWPEIKSTGKRNWVEGFSLVWTEVAPQS